MCNRKKKCKFEFNQKNISMQVKYVIASLALVILMGCATKQQVTETPKQQSIQVAGVPLSEGQVLYESKCGNCHELHSPSKFKPEQWRPILLDMQHKAKITDAQREQIFEYLIK
ncbi:MAG: hypothetical protein RLY43_813 [Bacteroidota bacterium]|jgi:cytochrome c5